MVVALQSCIVARDMIKPSSPTPNHQRIHNLSFFDQICAPIYVPLVFFYLEQACPGSSNVQQKTCLLKESLSQLLTKYYPLAGRIRDNVTIDCNDEGVEFLEARRKCTLSDILNYPDDETIKSLLPDDVQDKEPILSSLLIVQVTFFNCGGTALALCLSHKIMDMASWSFFIKNWAHIARKSGEEVCPEFKIGSLFPPIDLSILKSYQPPEKVKCITRRFVFYSSKIAKLKDMVANAVQYPTQVEVVTALLYKCAIFAARKISSSLSTPTVLHQSVDLHSRVSPPLPGCTAGNLAGIFAVPTVEESELELICLVNKIKKKKNEFCNACKKKSSPEELCSFILESSKGLRDQSCQDVYLSTSWCRFPLYKATDFGWGKPVWVTTVSCGVKNVITMMDASEGDGIEAFVTLEEQQMALFEHDKDLISFSSINPIVLPTS